MERYIIDDLVRQPGGKVLVAMVLHEGLEAVSEPTYIRVPAETLADPDAFQKFLLQEAAISYNPFPKDISDEDKAAAWRRLLSIHFDTAGASQSAW